MNRLYPDHIYDPLRRKIATALIEKELDKLGINTGEAAKLLGRKLDGEHTFWNGFEGLMGGILLKPLVDRLTAANFAWTEQDLKVDDIQLASKLEQLNLIPNLDPHKLFLKDIKAYLTNHPAEEAEHKKIAETFAGTDLQNSYPVIAQTTEDGFMVLDGNRRALLAAMRGEPTVKAWVCDKHGEEPKDFWYPIGDMIRLVYLYKTNESPELLAALRTFFKDLFSRSKVAEIAFRKRVVEFHTPKSELFLPEYKEPKA